MENKLKDEAMGVHCEFVKMVSHTDFDESIHWAMKLGMPKDREHLPHAVVDRLAAIERGEETWPPERFQEVIHVFGYYSTKSTCLGNNLWLNKKQINFAVIYWVASNHLSFQANHVPLQSAITQYFGFK